MIIEVRKAEFENKGAELMLRSIVTRLRREFPDAILAMRPKRNAAPYTDRAALRLYQKAWLRRYGIAWDNAARLLPVELRRLYGLVLDFELDVVIDAAGFSYGDHNSGKSLQEAARSARRWKRQGTKLILMPQAFGPFSDSTKRRAMKILVDNANLVFARDQISYDHIVDVAGQQSHVTIAPDFTNLIEGEGQRSFDLSARKFCIIPNNRMVAKSETTSEGMYLKFLVVCTRYLVQRNQCPFVLIHEGEKDLWLANELRRRVGGHLNIVVEDSALRIKGIIGQCQGVISSRFHGLVSALSQGVPALATSWSHKYRMLLHDYGFPEGLIDVASTSEEIEAKIDLLIGTHNRDPIVERVIRAAADQKEKSERMWNEVISVIRE